MSWTRQTPKIRNRPFSGIIGYGGGFLERGSHYDHQPQMPGQKETGKPETGLFRLRRDRRSGPADREGTDPVEHPRIHRPDPDRLVVHPRKKTNHSSLNQPSPV